MGYTQDYNLIVISMTKVKNVNGSSRFPKPQNYDSWLEYWERQTGKKARSCSAVGCGARTDLVGAHVQKAYGDDKHYYIVPLCSACNQRADTFDVEAELVPVPSNL
jgi:hypothetical protein